MSREAAASEQHRQGRESRALTWQGTPCSQLPPGQRAPRLLPALAAHHSSLSAGSIRVWGAAHVGLLRAVQSSVRLKKQIANAVKHVLDVHSPFGTVGAGSRELVVAFEVLWSDVQGIDYTNPLLVDGRIVLEAAQVTKREFSSVRVANRWVFSSVLGPWEAMRMAPAAYKLLIASVDPCLCRVTCQFIVRSVW